MRIPTTGQIVLLALILSLPGAGTAVAQQSDPVIEAAAAEADIPADPFGRGTPRRSLEGYLRAVDAADFDRALEYLDMRNLPAELDEFAPTDIAWGLAIVIEREFLLNLEELSDDPDGAAGDGLPAYRDEFGRLTADGKDYVFYMQRVPRGDGERVWKVSNRTVAHAAELYEQFGYGPIADYLAETMPKGSFLGVAYFKWTLVLGSIVIAYPLFYLVGLVLTRLFCKPSHATYAKVRRFLTVPVAVLMTVLVMGAVLESLGVGLTAQQFFRAQTLTTIGSTWVLLSAAGLFREVYTAWLERQGKPGAAVLLRPATNAIRVLIVLAAALVWLDNLGYNITTLLAGLGVGGVAVALALQKPLEDVFGALSLYTQQPVRIGNFCKIGDYTGTVEEIGLRTTRLRTLANTVVVIPNRTLSTVEIDNYSARRMILYRPKLRLRYDTTEEQLQQILDSLRQMLASHEYVVQEAPRVRFMGFGEDALLVEIFAYLATNDYATYLEYAEDVHLKVLAIVNAAGTNLALPTQSMYIENARDVVKAGSS